MSEMRRRRWRENFRYAFRVASMTGIGVREQVVELNARVARLEREVERLEAERQRRDAHSDPGAQA